MGVTETAMHWLADRGVCGQLYFRGRRGLDAVIQSLNETGMSSATDILVAGCSAGGLATYFHCTIYD